MPQHRIVTRTQQVVSREISHGHLPQDLTVSVHLSPQELIVRIERVPPAYEIIPPDTLNGVSANHRKEELQMHLMLLLRLDDTLFDLLRQKNIHLQAVECPCSAYQDQIDAFAAHACQELSDPNRHPVLVKILVTMAIEPMVLAGTLPSATPFQEALRDNPATSLWAMEDMHLEWLSRFLPPTVGGRRHRVGSQRTPFSLAQDPSTPPDVLDSLYIDGPKTKDVCRALAHNPNASHWLLHELAYLYPEIVFHNPAMALLQLEDPDFFRSFLVEDPKRSVLREAPFMPLLEKPEYRDALLGTPVDTVSVTIPNTPRTVGGTYDLTLYSGGLFVSTFHHPNVPHHERVYPSLTSAISMLNVRRKTLGLPRIETWQGLKEEMHKTT